MKKTLYSLLAVCIALMGLNSCSSSGDDVLSSIPASSQLVIALDAQKALDAFGFSQKDGKFTLPAAIPASMEANMVLSQFDTFCEAVDINNIYFVLTDMMNEQGFAVAALKDADNFKALLTGAESSEVDGFTCYDTGMGSAIITKDNLVWAIQSKTSAEGTVKQISDILDAAKEKSLVDLEGVKTYLESEPFCKIVCNNSALGLVSPTTDSKENGDVWGLASINIKDKTLTIDACSQYSDGREVKTEGYQNINSADLAYVPGDFNAVAALGISPNFPWQQVLNQASAGATDAYAQSMMMTALPYLQALNGTILAGCKLDASVTGEKIPPFLIMAHMNQETVNDIISTMRTFMDYGANVTEENGMLTIQEGPNTVQIGNVNGCLTVANVPIVTNNQNSLAPTFDGKEGALLIDIPSLSAFGYGMPSWGIKVTGQMQPSGSTLSCSIVNTDKSLIEALMELN